MTEALYTHNAYHNVYGCYRQEMQTMWPRVGAEARERTADLPEMQIPVLEPGTTEGEKVMPPPKDPVRRAEYCKKMSHPGKDNPFFGKKHTEESRSKMSESHKGVSPSEETRRKQSEARTGKTLSPTHRTNISASHAGKKREPFSPAWIAKMSESHKGKFAGENHPFYGKHLSEETKAKLSLKNKGQKRSKEFCNRISEAIKGEGHPNWKGGISFEPYCPKFTKEFKERVRQFFGHKCVECGEPQNGVKLSVHHVNFNKKTCCDNSTPLFVALCHSCHSKTGFNREYWEQHFTQIINEQYGGKCYLSKEDK
jgi:hypothetical protein